MTEVKWIKITTDIFDDEKILLIESMPDAYAMITVWFKLLCLAGKMNNSGVFMMSNRLAYTDKMLATIFRMKDSTVQLALATFEQFGMIEIVDGIITIPNWEKHQSLEALELSKEKTRQRVAAYRDKQKKLTECNAYSNVTGNVTVTLRNAVDIDIDKDIEKDIDNNISTPPETAAVLTLTLNDKSEYPIFQTDIDEWQECFPAVDVMQQLRQMKSWCHDNPTKRKTKNGIRKFINTWLSKDQDRGGRNYQPQKKFTTAAQYDPMPSSHEEKMKAFLEEAKKGVCHGV